MIFPPFCLLLFVAVKLFNMCLQVYLYVYTVNFVEIIFMTSLSWLWFLYWLAQQQ